MTSAFSCQTPLILSFINYDQAFDSVDSKALAKILSLYGIPDKYIKVICVMYENNTAGVKVGNEVANWFCIKSGFIWIILTDFMLRSIGKAIGDIGIQQGGKTLLNIGYTDDLGLLDESEQNEWICRGFVSLGC